MLVQSRHIATLSKNMLSVYPEKSSGMNVPNDELFVMKRAE